MKSVLWRLGLWGVLISAGVVFLVAGSQMLLKVMKSELGPKAAGYYAKQYCSCRFVQKGSPQECEEKSRVYVPARIEEFQDDKGQGVRSEAWGYKAEARWMPSGETDVRGCVLQTLESGGGASI
jgi:hypothetical protein